jgi:uncharacterized protein (TIGR03032 family)
METTPSSLKLEITCSRHFSEWLAEQRVSLAITTYQANKLFLVGVKPDGRFSVFERTFPRCMGVWSDGETIWLATQFQLWRLENMLAPGETSDGYDRLYVPRHGYVTGDIDIHDLSVDTEKRPVFVNTLFSCLATLDERYNFRPLWRPPFISRLAAEDRCHLNGLAMQDGRPRYVTAAGQSDVADGWRDRRRDGGCVIDVDSGAVILEGLCMPHSPRLEGNRLWLLEGGAGQLGFVDLPVRRIENPSYGGGFTPVTFCPGFTRGLALVGGFAVVGLSKARHDQTFQGLPLQEELAQRRADARCGVHVIDRQTGDAVHWLRIDGPVEELYDVVVLPGVARPKALGFVTDEIRHQVWFAEEGQPPAHWSGAPRS